MDWNFSDFSDITTLSRLVYIYDKCPLNVRHLRGLKSRKNGNFSPQLVASLWKMSLPLEISSWMGRGMHFFRMLQKYQAISAKKWQKKKKTSKSRQHKYVCEQTAWLHFSLAFAKKHLNSTFLFRLAFVDFPRVLSVFCQFFFTPTKSLYSHLASVFNVQLQLKQMFCPNRVFMKDLSPPGWTWIPH